MIFLFSCERMNEKNNTLAKGENEMRRFFFSFFFFFLSWRALRRLVDTRAFFLLLFDFYPRNNFQRAKNFAIKLEMKKKKRLMCENS